MPAAHAMGSDQSAHNMVGALLSGASCTFAALGSFAKPPSLAQIACTALAALSATGAALIMSRKGRRMVDNPGMSGHKWTSWPAKNARHEKNRRRKVLIICIISLDMPAASR